MADGSANLTEEASPVLNSYMSRLWANCLGPEGVADYFAAEVTYHDNEIPQRSVDCLAREVMGDEEDFMGVFFSWFRDEPPSSDAMKTTADHMAACLPYSLIVQNIFNFEEAEVGCLDDSLRSSPALANFFREQFGVSALQLSDDESLNRHLYDCVDTARMILGSAGGTEGISPEALECIAITARAHDYFDTPINADPDPDFEEGLYACFSSDDIAVLESRS